METAEKKYTCSCCKSAMPAVKFYTYKDGSKVEICKDCLCAHINNFEPDTFVWILKKMDVPYIPCEWNILRDHKYQEDPVKGTSGPTVISKYLARMKLKQWHDRETGKPYTWNDSERLIAIMSQGQEIIEGNKKEAARIQEIEMR